MFPHGGVNLCTNPYTRFPELSLLVKYCTTWSSWGNIHSQRVAPVFGLPFVLNAKIPSEGNFTGCGEQRVKQTALGTRLPHFPFPYSAALAAHGSEETLEPSMPCAMLDLRACWAARAKETFGVHPGTWGSAQDQKIC